jgi:hypothetical protein
MKDIELIDHTLGRIAQSGDMEIEIEARDLERICRLALEQVKNCSIPDVRLSLLLDKLKQKQTPNKGGGMRPIDYDIDCVRRTLVLLQESNEA